MALLPEIPLDFMQWGGSDSLEATSSSPVIHSPGGIDSLNLEVSGPVDVREIGGPNVPVSFTLGQNYPNPFNPITNIPFEVARRSDVCVGIYNIGGQKVRVLHEGSLSVGKYEIPFDARGLASGVYFYRVSVGDEVASKKMVLLK